MITVFYHGPVTGRECVEIESETLSRYKGFSTKLWENIKRRYNVSDSSDDVVVFDAIDDYFSSMHCVLKDSHPAGFMPNGGGEKRVW